MSFVPPYDYSDFYSRKNNKSSNPKISMKRKHKIYERDGYQCLKCGKTKKLTIDHILPKSKGGGNESSNLQTLCAPCNTEKGAQEISYL